MHNTYSGIEQKAMAEVEPQIKYMTKPVTILPGIKQMVIHRSNLLLKPTQNRHNATFTWAFFTPSGLHQSWIHKKLFRVQEYTQEPWVYIHKIHSGVGLRKPQIHKTYLGVKNTRGTSNHGYYLWLGLRLPHIPVQRVHGGQEYMQ